METLNGRDRPLLYLLNLNDLKYIQMSKVQTFTTSGKGGLT